jgi:microcystin-dependent protein
MSPYIGEIRMFAGNFPPVGWMFCEGQLMPISENDALFVVLGTTYGGDGQETFALPNLQSRVPIHQGDGPDGTTYQIGEAAGTEQETLTIQQIPNHSHPYTVSTTSAPQNAPAGAMVGNSASLDLYFEAPATENMSNQAITPAGGSQPHENTQPFLCINFIISLFGVFPSPT